MDTQLPFHPRVAHALEPGEEVRIQATSTDAVLTVTNRRLVITDAMRTVLAVPFTALRRVQFDLERSRPATLVIVPEHATDEPQVLAIPPDQYRAAADVLVALGEALGPTDLH
jgi:hypothetical protein